MIVENYSIFLRVSRAKTQVGDITAIRALQMISEPKHTERRKVKPETSANEGSSTHWDRGSSGDAPAASRTSEPTVGFCRHKEKFLLKQRPPADIKPGSTAAAAYGLSVKPWDSPLNELNVQTSSVSVLCSYLITYWMKKWRNILC